MDLQKTKYWISLTWFSLAHNSHRWKGAAANEYNVWKRNKEMEEEIKEFEEVQNDIKMKKNMI